LSPAPAKAEQEALDLLDQAWSLGIDTLDTAFSYGSAHEVISKSDKPFKIHTKLEENLFEKNTIESFSEIFKNKIIEILYFHNPAAAENSTLLYEATNILKPYQIELGVSIYLKREFIGAVQDKNLGAIQAPVNIFNRQIDSECFALALHYNKKVIVRSIFLQGLISTNWNQLIHKTPNLVDYLKNLELIATKHSISIEECAFAWLNNFSTAYGVIIGVENMQQLNANYKFFQTLQNRPELIEDLNTILVPNPDEVDPRNWNFKIN
jgi:aryl-alcohol dehydrogenase-like predicted oxidoreductase